MILFIFREGEREKEKHQCVVASCTPPTGDLAHNPGLWPDWESDQQPFGFTGQHSIHWATPARAENMISKVSWRNKCLRIAVKIKEKTFVKENLPCQLWNHILKVRLEQTFKAVQQVESQKQPVCVRSRRLGKEWIT